MKIETLIQAIQNNPNDVDVVVRLVARLEGMLPNVETARGVATKLLERMRRDGLVERDALRLWHLVPTAPG